MGNPPIMHYVVFLLHHGLRPYSEITDSNMPGSYITQGAAIAAFGASDLSWRMYEFFLMGVMAAAMIAIARRWDPIAGAFAAALFLALHAAEGPEYAGERDLVAAVLLMVSTALLLECLDGARLDRGSPDRGRPHRGRLDRRRPDLSTPDLRTPVWMLGVGLGWGLAASIKPTFLGFPAGLSLLTVYVCTTRKESPWRYLTWAAAGLVLAALLNVAFLIRFHAWGDFLQVLTSALPSYRRMPGGPSTWIGYRSLPRRGLVLLVPAAILWLASSKLTSGKLTSGKLTALKLVASQLAPSTDWRLGALLLSAGCGLLSFLAQGKGFIYHRYALVMFLLLLASVILIPRLRTSGWRGWTALITTALTLATILPSSWRAARILGTQSDLAVTFQHDLEALGGRAQLEGKVQCLDLSYGCLNALYHLRLVENSAFTGDMMFFRPEPSPMRELSRSVFWDRAQRDPASVLMISNQSFSLDDGFARLDHWPEFVNYLGANYVEVAERHFEHEHFGGKFRDPVRFADQDAYRLYIRRGSPLLAQALRLPQTSGLHPSVEEAQAMQAADVSSVTPRGQPR